MNQSRIEVLTKAEHDFYRVRWRKKLQTYKTIAKLQSVPSDGILIEGIAREKRNHHKVFEVACISLRSTKFFSFLFFSLKMMAQAYKAVSPALDDGRKVNKLNVISLVTELTGLGVVTADMPRSKVEKVALLESLLSKKRARSGFNGDKQL